MNNLPQVKKGEALDEWLKRSVPALVESFKMPAQKAESICRQAYMAVNPSATTGKAGWLDEEEEEKDSFEWSDPENEWGEPLSEWADQQAQEEQNDPVDEMAEEQPATDEASGSPQWFASRIFEYAQMLSANLVSSGAIDPERCAQIDAAAQMMSDLLGKQLEGKATEPEPAKQEPVEPTEPKPESKPEAESQAEKPEGKPTEKPKKPEGKEEDEADFPFKKKTDKAMTLMSLFESEIHLNFTRLADSWRQQGYLTRDERIIFSSAVGAALEAFVTTIEAKLPRDVAYRNAYTEVKDPDPAPPVETNAEKTEVGQNAETSTQWMNEEEEDEKLPEVTATKAVKALGEDRFGGYLVLWGDPVSSDLDGEFFTKDTEELTVIFDAMKALPVLWHHGADPAIKSTVVGMIESMKADDVGLWVEARVKEHQLYKTHIAPLMDGSMLGWSSGAVPRSAKAEKSTGKIRQWAIFEGTLTHTPTDWRMMTYPVDYVKSVFAEAALGDVETLL